MRSRLARTLSLLLLSAVAITVVAMGSILAFNLRRGFADYVEQRDIERLERFADVVAEHMEAVGATDGVALQRLDMRQLQRMLARREGRPEGAADEPAPWPPRHPDPDRPPPPPRPPHPPPVSGEGLDPQPRPRMAPGPGAPGFDPPPGREEPPPRRRRPEPPDGFLQRVQVLALDGRLLTGQPLEAGAPRLAERPVAVRGRIAATVRLAAGPPVPDAVEARFLRSQYGGIAAVATALVLLSLGVGWWVARRWARPLMAIQDATARIARGEFDVRLQQDTHDEIGDVVRNVNLMAEALKRLEQSRRRWIADISHELRTPLTVLRGEIDALIDGVRPLRAEAVLSLREEVVRLSALVEDLHLLSLSDLQALPCHPVPTDAKSLVEDVVQRFMPRAQAQGLELSLGPLPAGPLPVQWDPARITQLLTNLLENSLRYTDAPGRVLLRLQAAPGRVQLDLEDTAPGVPTRDLPRLFEPLYRADAARSRHRGGSGLGLAICEAIVRSHGGHIRVAASALGGLHLHIELPAQVGGAFAGSHSARDRSRATVIPRTGSG